MTSARPAGLVLAGGLSRRMGTDKTQQLLAGRRMIDHVVERLKPQVSELWINAPACYPQADGTAIVPDTLSGHQGPLAGILAGMLHARRAIPALQALVTAPGDTPFLPHDLVASLKAASRDGSSIAIARSGGRDHPVAALWPMVLAGDLEAWLVNPENRKVMAFIARHDYVSVDFAPHPSELGEIDPFFNVNTPADLVRAEAIFKAISL